MRTVLLGQPPTEVKAWLERRRALGQDLFDEVWEGDYHVAPAAHGRHGRIDDQLARILGPRADAGGLYGSGPLNIGRPDDYRVPDRAYLRTASVDMYQPTAAIIVEIVSPGDETRRKFGFYYDAGVEELLIVDPEAQTVEWFSRGGDGFVAADASRLLGLSAAALVAELTWPA
jgi:Uma2 family endonuclease